jgi:hypothetical protein
VLLYVDLAPATGPAQRLHETTSHSLTKNDGLTGPTTVRGQTWDRPEEHGAVEPARQFMSARLSSQPLDARLTFTPHTGDAPGLREGCDGAPPTGCANAGLVYPSFGGPNSTISAIGSR